MKEPRAAVHLHIRRFLSNFPACLSVKVGTDPTHYSSWAIIKDCRLTVAPAGRKRFIETGQKNVHAFVRGTLIAESRAAIAETSDDDWYDKGWVKARYNPALHDSFVLLDGTKISRADVAFLNREKLWVLNPS